MRRKIKSVCVQDFSISPREIFNPIPTPTVPIPEESLPGKIKSRKKISMRAKISRLVGTGSGSSRNTHMFCRPRECRFHMASGEGK